MMVRSIVEINKGMKFGRLIVIKELPQKITPSGYKARIVRLKCTGCDSEKIIDVYLSNLKNKNRPTQSCGCLRLDIQKKKSEQSGIHHYLDSTYKHMISRCYDNKNDNYKYYGKRGIKVCKLWREKKDRRGFWNFIAWAEDNGWYDGCKLELDRRDNDGNYKPSNCRWRTRKQQMRNTRRNVIVNYKGKDMVAIRAVEKYGIYGLTVSVFLLRLKANWHIEDALTIPVRIKKSHTIPTKKIN